jgi:hypothetical protein
MPNKTHWAIIFFGIIEIVIGAATLVTIIFSLILGTSDKPPAILAFVLVTSVVSLSIGVGILKSSMISYYLLLYFSTVIILSKILVFFGIIVLSGALETSIPSGIKNTVSIIYHSVLLICLNAPSVKKQFCKNII